MKLSLTLKRLVVAKDKRHAAMSVTIDPESSDWVFSEHDHGMANRFAAGMSSKHWRVYPVTLTIEVDEAGQPVKQKGEE